MKTQTRNTWMASTAATVLLLTIARPSFATSRNIDAHTSDQGGRVTAMIS